MSTNSLNANWKEINYFPDFFPSLDEASQDLSTLAQLEDNIHLGLELDEGTQRLKLIAREAPSEIHTPLLTLHIAKVFFTARYHNTPELEGLASSFNRIVALTASDEVQAQRCTALVLGALNKPVEEAQEALSGHYSSLSDLPQPYAKDWFKPKHMISHSSDYFGQNLVTLVDKAIHFATPEDKMALLRDLTERANALTLTDEGAAALAKTLQKGIKQGAMDNLKAAAWSGRSGMDADDLFEIALECRDQRVIEAILRDCTETKESKQTRTGNWTGGNQKYLNRFDFATRLMTAWVERYNTQLDQEVVQEAVEAVQNMPEEEPAAAPDAPLTKMQKLRQWAAAQGEYRPVNYAQAHLSGQAVVFSNQ